MKTSWREWYIAREAVETQSQIDATLRDANAAIDNAFKFIQNSITKTYGNRTSIPTNVRDSLVADLQTLIKKISGLQPQAVKECCEFIKAEVIKEADVLGVPGRDVGGKQSYPMQQVLDKISTHIKQMMSYVVHKVADTKVGGAVGDVGSQVSDLGTSTNRRLGGIEKGISAIQRGPGNEIPHGSEHEHIAKDNLARLAMFAKDQFSGRISIHPGTDRGQDLMNRIDPRDMSSIDKLWHLVQPSRTLKIRFQVPGKKTQDERIVDITSEQDVERKIADIQSIHNMSGANYGVPQAKPGMRLAK